MYIPQTKHDSGIIDQIITIGMYILKQSWQYPILCSFRYCHLLSLLTYISHSGELNIASIAHDVQFCLFFYVYYTH